MKYLESDIDLHFGALFFLACEDRGSIATGPRACCDRAVSIDVSGVRVMVNGETRTTVRRPRGHHLVEIYGAVKKPQFDHRK
jgi:hypothetical protein